MKRTLIFVLSMVIVIGCMAASALAYPISGISTEVKTFYQGSTLVDQGNVYFSNSGTTTIVVGLHGFGGQDRGWHSNTVTGNGPRTAVSGYVDHEYENEYTVYSLY